MSNHTLGYGRHNRHPSSRSTSRRPSREPDVEAQSDTHDFALGRSSAHVQILEPPQDTQHDGDVERSPTNLKRTDTAMSKSTMKSVRRRGRAGTYNVSYNAMEMGRTTGWSPGQEPGIDTNDPAPPYSQSSAIGGDAANPQKLNQRCEITVVDYNYDNVQFRQR